ncbi:MAG: protein-export membrane protein SecF [Candidatus Glassbacteria bacterium RIFCSPLOWO2_12_FULL_58_11]|uniref:Protein-export membrane protein SecF n=2 Tax=Candidatus Glassiibacteriota TaxID=1817805 RepID=A0A1F5YWX2_9BACT|nr:MAG: protein-export membrane protein SecF [Candidatus Glassbacteria bacterium GWA2_58_10]OGG04583.1 MAG: protein-export membrane protein SecF [Candidatus Glassbacteria bacterium RIFCSPLOWO2_12_FULL_58_11]
MIEIFKNPNYQFIALRYKAIIISLIVIGLGILSMILRGGPRYGIDFTGGAAITFSFEKDISAEEVRQALRQAGIQSYEVTHFGDQKHVLVRLQLAETNQNYLTPIQQQLDTMFAGNKYVIDQNDLVGPKIGTELREKALLALLFSMIGMIIYISVRFEAESFFGVLITLIFGLLVLAASSLRFVLNSDIWTIALILFSIVVVGYICLKFNFKYAVGAIAALIHDVMVTVGLFSIMDKEINLTIIAALLTIVGYSINDTIVIFDRIREEYPKERKRLSLPEVINNCINHTLSRTIITSLTVFFVVLVLLIFGGEVIRPFALALFIGVIAGTYSTIYIAAPVLIFWQERYGTGAEITRKVTA